MNIKNSSAFATQLVIAALVVLGTGGGLGFAIVDLRHDISVSANNTRLIEQRILESERLVAEVGGAIAAEQSPEVLARRNQSLALGLVQPAEAQVVRVGESAVARLAAKRNAEIFAAERGEVVVPVRFNLGGAKR
ncbi:MAG: hypothetical protein RL376_1716 [Verrucomicrobiota bacterium]|jgi:hypothetical protein